MCMKPNKQDPVINVCLYFLKLTVKGHIFRENTAEGMGVMMSVVGSHRGMPNDRVAWEHDLRGFNAKRKLTLKLYSSLFLFVSPALSSLGFH